MTTDLISDMLTRIRNGSMANHTFTRVKYSKVNLGILKVFRGHGYIQNFQIESESEKKNIKISLRYKGWWIKKPLFTIIKRVSKPGQRVFSNYNEFNKKMSILRYEQGIAIISTSSGIMSHLKAKKMKKGGEILCYIE